MKPLRLEMAGPLQDVKGVAVLLDRYGVYFREGEYPPPPSRTIDPKHPVVFVLEQGVTSDVLRLLYDYWQDHEKNGVRIRMVSRDKDLELSSNVSLQEILELFTPSVPVSP